MEEKNMCGCEKGSCVCAMEGEEGTEEKEEGTCEVCGNKECTCPQ